MILGQHQIIADGLAPTDPRRGRDHPNFGRRALIHSWSQAKITCRGSGWWRLTICRHSSASKLANISTRGLVGTGDDVLIGGFIMGDVESNTVVIRAIGPSLASSGVSDPLGDPMLTVYDANGARHWRQ